VHPALREARDTLVPDPAGPHGPLPPLLEALTLVTGLVDAFSYLVLGRVFVANMTGNVIFLGFSLAGASGFSVPASLISLAAFVVGAVAGGRVAHAMAGRPGRLLAVTAAQTALVAAAWVLAATSELPARGGVRMALIVLLALAMGGQNAAVRKLDVPDLTTTVLTGTITAMASESRIAGGAGAKAGRQLLSAGALFFGALAGAALVVHVGRVLPLPVAGAVLAAVAAALSTQRRSTRRWAR
jgi:uncharacterized membrane protein YoaK (UPF0700 family)